MAFHFEGMAEPGEPPPQPKGLEYYLRTGEHSVGPKELLTTMPAEGLLAAFSVTTDLA